MVVFLVLYFIVQALWHLLRTARIQRGVRRAQLSIVIVAISLGTVIGVVTNVILPNILQNTYPSRFAFIAIIIWTGLLTYAVIQHRFLHIRLAIARTVAYLLVLFTLVVTYALAVFGVIELFFGQTQQVSMAQSIVYIVSAVFLAFTYAPLKLFFDRITDTIFFQHDYDVQTTLTNWAMWR